MYRPIRKTAPRVLHGKVMKKDRHEISAGLIDVSRSAPEIFRDRPGRGHHHVVSQRDLDAFIRLIPDWPELSRGLSAILLARAYDSCDGWHRPGLVAICAWESSMSVVRCKEYVEAHRSILDRLGVVCEPDSDDYLLCRFSENQARAFMLLHIFLHELGHHHDRMTTHTRNDAARGEDYAESWAFENESRLWDRYVREFDVF